MKGAVPEFSEIGQAMKAAKEKQQWRCFADSWERCKMLLFFSESLDMAKQTPSAYGNSLKSFKSAWDKFKEPSKQGSQDVPVGEYVARLKLLRAHFYDEKDQQGNPTGKKIPGALGQFTVLSGDYTGEAAPWFPRFPLDDEEALLRFMRDLRRLGGDVDNVDLGADGALEAEYARLTALHPGVKIKRAKGNRGDQVFTNILQSYTEDQMQALVGASAGGSDVIVEEPIMEEGIVVEEPTIAVEPAAPVVAAPKAAPKTAAPAAARPPKTAPVAPPVTAVEEPTVEVQIGGETGVVVEEPQAVEVVEEVPTIDIGKRVQFKLNGKLTFGLIKARDDAKASWLVRDEASSKNLLVPYTLSTLALAE